MITLSYFGLGFMLQGGWVLCCKVGSLLMIYLGKPHRAHYKGLSIWNPIIEKMERRLSGWKYLYMLKGG